MAKKTRHIPHDQILAFVRGEVSSSWRVDRYLGHLFHSSCESCYRDFKHAMAGYEGGLASQQNLREAKKRAQRRRKRA
ncbi:MAG: hypothetical protein G01um101424_158 [Parcubacteria group bacterium Gr01-1014_24]|nr:MAG: hypothetical protein G01um101424_158 [Parcubacteria group bacterium Gr01-1014_24]